MGKRLPTILGKAIDDTVKTLNEESEEERIVDLVECIHRMDTLMDDMIANRQSGGLISADCVLILSRQAPTNHR